TWQDGLGQGLGSDSCLIFALGEPRFVYAIRLRYSFVNTGDTPVLLRIFWRNGANGFSEDTQNATVKLMSASKEKNVTIWVNDTIDRFRLHPDNKPFGIMISGITLLVPDQEPLKTIP
ncbi:MAG TPA: hypothetical protein VGY77_07175, partial [Gemmataceae bacterium]|nr:hypothetical protein [Gemmataceae bacterium]